MKVGRSGFGALASVRPYILLSPALILLGLLGVSLFLLVVYSFYTFQQGGGMVPELTLENYLRLTNKAIYWKVIWNTIRIGIVVTALNFLLGYPLAYYLRRLPPRFRSVFFLLLLAPLWTSVIVRTYGWAIVLGRFGVINGILSWLGLGEVVLNIYPGFWAIVLGLLEIYLPIMVLPIFASLLSIDPQVEEASLTLGAGPIRTFLKVTLPLSVPGIFAGVLLSFVLTIGAYVTPVILGSAQDLVLPVLIEGQINRVYNIPFASTLAIVMLLLMSIVIIAFRRFVRLDQLFGW